MPAPDLSDVTLRLERVATQLEAVMTDREREQTEDAEYRSLVNKRITSLERWRAGMVGAWSLLVVLWGVLGR